MSLYHEHEHQVLIHSEFHVFQGYIILGIGGQPASKKPLVYINKQSRCGHWTDQSLKAFQEPTYMYAFQAALIDLLPYYRRYRYSIHRRLIFTQILPIPWQPAWCLELTFTLGSYYLQGRKRHPKA